jgi:hypothetical protein
MAHEFEAVTGYAASFWLVKDDEGLETAGRSAASAECVFAEVSRAWSAG